VDGDGDGGLASHGCLLLLSCLSLVARRAVGVRPPAGLLGRPAARRGARGARAWLLGRHRRARDGANRDSAIAMS